MYVSKDTTFSKSYLLTRKAPHWRGVVPPYYLFILVWDFWGRFCNRVQNLHRNWLSQSVRPWSIFHSKWTKPTLGWGSDHFWRLFFDCFWPQKGSLFHHFLAWFWKWLTIQPKVGLGEFSKSSDFYDQICHFWGSPDWKNIGISRNDGESTPKNDCFGNERIWGFWVVQEW